MEQKARKKPYEVYVLRSLRDKKRYSGISINSKSRVTYCEKYGTLQEARAREKYFKTAAGRCFLDKAESKLFERGWQENGLLDQLE